MLEYTIGNLRKCRVLFVTSGYIFTDPKIIVGPKKVMEEVKLKIKSDLPIININSREFKTWLKKHNPRVRDGYDSGLVHIKSLKEYEDL